jgi:hypothetical protein
MTPRKPESAASAKRRHIATLARAYAQHWGEDGAGFTEDGSQVYAIIRAAVRATIPGTQRTKALAPAMEQAVKAAARTIRNRK